MDIIKVDVPTFLRLLELAREEVKDDADLHDIAEVVTKMSKEGTVTMQNYEAIVSFMKKQGSDSTEESVDELDRIRQLGGLQ